MSKQRTAVVKLLSSIEVFAAVSSLIMVSVENMQKSADYDRTVRDWRGRYFRIYNIHGEEAVTRINDFHPLGPLLMDLGAQDEGLFQVNALHLPFHF